MDGKIWSPVLLVTVIFTGSVKWFGHIVLAGLSIKNALIVITFTHHLFCLPELFLYLHDSTAPVGLLILDRHYSSTP